MAFATRARRSASAVVAAILAACAHAPAHALPSCQGNCSIGTDVRVGGYGGGDGTLLINGGDVVATGGTGSIGSFGSGLGTVLVSGGGSRLSLGGITSSGLFIGSDLGTGVLTVQQAAQLTVDARDAGTGFGDARVYLGVGGSGRLNVLGGASVIVRDQGPWGADEDIHVGYASTAGPGDGHLLLDTAASLLLSGNLAAMNVGRSNTSVDRTAAGTGVVEVRGGSSLTIDGTSGAGYLFIARGGNSDGKVFVSGSGSLVDVTGTVGAIYVSSSASAVNDRNDGVALLQVSDGGVVRTRATSGNGLTTAMVIGAGMGSGAVRVEAGGRIELGGTLSVSQRSGTFDNQTGHLFIAQGGTVNAARTFVGDGLRSQINGTLAGAGVINGAVTVRRGGLLSPGASPGTLTIGGDVSFIDGGMLRIEVAGLGSGSFDRLVATGAASWSGGVIEFVFTDGFLPRQGDVIDFLAAASFSGLESAQFVYSGAAPGFQFQVEPDGGALHFTAQNNALPVPEPATWLCWAAGLAALSLIRIQRRR